MKINSYINKYLSRFDEHTVEVIKKSAASVIVKILGMIIGLGVSIYIGRTLGAEGIGIINLSNRIVNILLIIGLIGIQQVIIKEVAIANNKGDNEHIGNVMHTCYLLNGSISFALSIILIFLSPWLANHFFNEPRLTFPLMISLLVATPQIFSRLFSSALVGFKKIWQSNLVEQTLSIAITGLFLLLISLLEISLTINLLAILYAIGRIIVTISVGLYWRTVFSYKSKKQIIPKKLLKTSMPLFALSISGLFLSNTDIIVLSWLSDTKDVGLYAIASRIALLNIFFLQITNSALSPKIAALYEMGKLKEIERMVQNVTKGLSIIGVVSLLLFISFGSTILNIWGNEFISAYWILIILSLGQLFNIGTGAVGVILVMTGHEKIQSKISITFAILNIIFNIILIKEYGVIGAAISTALIYAISNIVKVILVKRLVGINPIISLNI